MKEEVFNRGAKVGKEPTSKQFICMILKMIEYQPKEPHILHDLTILILKKKRNDLLSDHCVH
ncbi:MAG TPA: hypothetical protein PL185_14145 [Flavobacteriales bacterium]|jgi:hypothetical protein|nr:hypothetical protein [Flavobacteriales bacterium]HPH83716.1 hypothetical protein [Flavobacteriales bacterium]